MKNICFYEKNMKHILARNNGQTVVKVQPGGSAPLKVVL